MKLSKKKLEEYMTLLNSEEYEDEEDDYSEPGCAACGNPAYPMCKDSCPLFD